MDMRFVFPSDMSVNVAALVLHLGRALVLKVGRVAVALPPGLLAHEPHQASFLDTPSSQSLVNVRRYICSHTALGSYPACGVIFLTVS